MTRITVTIEAGAITCEQTGDPAGTAITHQVGDLAGRSEMQAEAALIVDPAVPHLVTVEPFRSLTERELEIVVHVTAGLTYIEIERRLGITERTVRTHMSNILGKLGIPSARALGTWALLAGMVTPEQVVALWHHYQAHLLRPAA